MLSMLSDIVGSAATAGIQTAGNMYLQDRAFNQNKELWREQQAYDTPTAQMARLKDAKLNPHLIYGNGAGALSGPAPTTTAKPAELGSLSKYAEIKNRNAETDRIDVTNMLTRQQAQTSRAGELETFARIAGIYTDNALKANELVHSNESRKAGVRVTDPAVIRLPITYANRIMDYVNSGIGNMVESVSTLNAKIKQSQMAAKRNRAKGGKK